MGRRKVRVRPGGCLRSVIVLAALCAIIILGVNAIRSQRPDDAEGEISDLDPVKSQYTTVSKTAEEIYAGDLVLVNQDAPYRFPEDFEPISLYDAKHDSYKVKDKDVLVRSEITEPLNAMLDDFYAVYHTDAVMVISGYRTYAYQATLLQNEIAEKGEAEALHWVTAPGCSEHHTGLAIDVCLYDDGVREAYTGTGDFAWINKNAYRYGFIVRYPGEKAAFTGISYEPWHFRYVGIPHAYVMRERGLCYEEYIDFLREYRFGERHLLVSLGDHRWEIYYTQETEVPIPKDRDYSISGNNVDGFIVTAAY